MLLIIQNRGAGEPRLQNSPGLLNISSAVKVEYVCVRSLGIVLVDKVRENLSDICKCNSLSPPRQDACCSRGYTKQQIPFII